MEAFWIILIAIVVLIGGFVFLLMKSQSRSKWGIGPLRPSCPRCGARLPMIRKPASNEEAMWGGWTCKGCGCKVDKYGRERVAS